MTNRPWYSTLVVLPRIVVRTTSMFRAQSLGTFAPAFFLLLLIAGMLWLINTVAPLAPFVYSLF